MNKINKKITENFQNNINYLESKHPLIFQKISAFENAIENGHYNEQYELVFENGDFDIFIKQTQEYLYKQEPKKFVRILTASVDFSRKNNLFIAMKTSDKKLEEQEMKEIKKFIFFGVANATHIEQVDKKISAKNYFIVEDDLELFRLSLMCIDYSKIAKHSKLYFSIFEDENEFQKTANFFLEEDFFYNHYIKFLQLPSFSEKKLEFFHSYIAMQSHFNFSYTSILEQYTKPIKRIYEGYSFTNLIRTKLPNHPTLLLAPGPSLSKHIGWLTLHQNKFLIIALSATLPLLEKHNIYVDIVIHYDGFERSKKHFEMLQSYKFIKNSLLLFSARTPTSILKKFQKDNIFLFENGTTYKQNIGNFSAFCAGSAGYLLTLILEIKKLYLLGLDLALNQETLQTHGSSYTYTTKATQSGSILSFRDSIIEKKGNFQQKVKTTPNFAISINAINEITKGLKKSFQQVYNLSDGAYFQNITPININELQLHFPNLEKRKLKKIIFKNFQQYAQKSFTLEERKTLNYSIEFAKNVKKKLQDQLEKKCLNNECIKKSLLNLKNLIFLNKEEQILSLILINYVKTHYPEIFDKLNVNLESNFVDYHTKTLQQLLYLTNKYIKEINAEY